MELLKILPRSKAVNDIAIISAPSKEEAMQCAYAEFEYRHAKLAQDNLNFTGCTLGGRLQVLLRDAFVDALAHCNWVQAEAARYLGVSVRTMHYQIEKYGITHSSWRKNNGNKEELLADSDDTDLPVAI